MYEWVSPMSSHPMQGSRYLGQFVSFAFNHWDSQHSGAQSWQRCICFMSISETRIECLLLPLLMPSPIQACSALYLILGRIHLWQSWGLMSDTLGMQFFYYWEGLDFTLERAWDEWVSIAFIETWCNISQGINRTMECWQRGWFSVTVETLQLFLELYSLFICIWILINRALAAYSWIFKWKYISHYYPLLVSQVPSCKFAAE